MDNKFYITTAIDYVNDTIHIGHAFQKIAADVLARYYRIKLDGKNVFFLTGTDEYGQKAEKAATESGISPNDLVKKISDSDQKEQDALNISYDRFIRTTDSDHKKSVQEIWNRVEKSGDIYLGKYTGLYCQGCEAYYTDGDLIDGKCPFHPNLEIKKVSEKNYFFKWSKYKEFLIAHITSNKDFIVPRFRAKEMLEFAKQIKDIPISRTNFTWGIPVPNDPKQVIYVWFDALTNYITGAGFPDKKSEFKKLWPADVHILGKDNLRWHSLLWPAILKSAGLELPKTILVNGFLSLNGQKISKSLGNIIRPSDWVEKFGADAVRYYLLRYTILTEDSDVSEEKLINAYNADLANGLGNLVARVARLCEKIELDNLPTPELSEAYKKSFEQFTFNNLLNDIWARISRVDQQIEQNKPWEIEDKNKLKNLLQNWVEQINQIAYELKPFIPETSEKIQALFSNSQVKSITPLFPRINRLQN